MSARLPLVRIATRGIRAHRARTILVIAMIALPVLALTVSFSFIETERRSETQFRQWSIGRADYVIDSPTRPKIAGTTSVSDNAVQSKGSENLIRRDGRVRAASTFLIEPATWRVLEPVYARRGSLPRSADDVMISESAAAWAQVNIGDSLRFRSGQKRVTAIVRQRSAHNATFVMTKATQSSLEPLTNRWLLDVNDDSDIADVDTKLAAIYAPAQIFNTRRLGSGIGSATNAAQQEITYLIGAFALVETVFVASAAFAVGARRRVRELALLQAVGADANTAGRIVTIEGVLLGCFGVAIGLLGGIVTAILMRGTFAASIEHDLDGLRFPWVLIGVSALAGLVAALVAAELPARELRKLDVVSALGDRPVHSPASNRWGLLGIVLAALGSVFIWYAASHGAGGVYTGRAVELGTILIVVGTACWTPIALHALARVAHRMPLPMRFAMREADRSRRRSSFAVSSVMALVAAVVAISCLGAPRVQADSAGARVATFRVTPDDQAKSIDAVGASAVLTTSAQDMHAAGYVSGFGRVGHGPARVELATQPQGVDPVTGLRGFLVLAIAPQSLEFLDPSKTATKMLDNNAIVVFGSDTETPTSTAKLTDDAGTIATLPVVGVGPLPPQIAVALELRQSNVAVISVATMEHFGLVGGSFFAAATHSTDTKESRPVTASERDHVRAALERVFDAPVEVPAIPSAFSIDGIRNALVLTGLLLAMAALAVAIALTAVESRRERTVLELIGMAPEHRRWLAAARAVLLGVTGGILGIPTGILPVLLLTKISAGRFRFLEQTFQIDWSVLALVAVLFPVVAGFAGWCWPTRNAQSAELRMPT